MNDTPKLTLKGERIAKVLARAGVCSRREAERMVEAGKVSVDGKVLDSPAFNVTGSEIILVEGKPLPDRQPVRLWRYNKPKGVITSNKDPEGRPTVFDKLPDGMPRVITVGRLDFNTEGLLLLTNDGDLGRYLEHPDNAFKRTYRCRVYGRPNEKRLAELEKGVNIEGIQYGPVMVNVESKKGDNTWMSVTITEGKNREVRKVLESVELTVNRLIRTSYGPFQLGKLANANLDEVPPHLLRTHFAGKVAGLPKSTKEDSGKRATTGGTAKAKRKPGNAPHRR